MGERMQEIALLLVGANVAVAMWLLFRRDARWAVVAWTFALFLTPVYVSFSLRGVALTILDVVVIVALAAGAPGVRLRWSVADTLVVAAFGSIGAALAFGGEWGHAQYTLISWLLPYAWGRVATARVGLEWVAACISVFAIIAAALAAIEFVTLQNLFVQLPGVGGAMWTGLQFRGGLLRAEGAFGHSISLGSALALSAPFLFATRWRWGVKLAGFVVIASGTAATLSRIGLIGLLLGVVCTALFLHGFVTRRQRIALSVTALVVTLAALPSLSQVFDDAGDEASGSAAYRADLVPLIAEMRWIGISEARQVTASGEDYFGAFRSIDSALILTGLRHGLIPLAILCALLVVCCWSVAVGRGTPASVGIVAQIPALATVALITQYAPMLWFVAGVAASAYSLNPRHGRLGVARDAGVGSNTPLGAV